ncbi:MAG: polysaccharide deacetylase family protein [Desulfosalsimonas sp.]
MKKNLYNLSKNTAVVSVHDVMPETFVRVKQIIRMLEKMTVFPVALLVVPGRQWSKTDINYLKSLQAAGYELAGHGWQHRSLKKTYNWHRLHGMLISRNEAEHLSLSTKAIAERIHACFRWFDAAGLAAPTLYVPPAWAMGKMPKKLLSTMPFRLYETQWGIYNAFAGISFRMPLAGYMADTCLRAKTLKINNLINRCLFFAPLRIAIHPNDLCLPMARDLKLHLAKVHRFLSYSDLSR